MQEEGCNDQITAEVVRCEFPDKTYGDIIFPAGWYDALRIKIGKAQGHNWGCVVFPSLCLPAVSEDSLAAAGLSQQDYALIQEETPAYIFQFHVVEWWEGFKHWWATRG